MSRAPKTAPTTIKPAGVRDIVIVGARPKDYRAIVEIADGNRLVVRPLSGQGMTTRARAIWRKALKEVVNHAG